MGLFWAGVQVLSQKWYLEYHYAYVSILEPWTNILNRNILLYQNLTRSTAYYKEFKILHNCNSYRKIFIFFEKDIWNTQSNWNIFEYFDMRVRLQLGKIHILIPVSLLFEFLTVTRKAHQSAHAIKARQTVSTVSWLRIMKDIKIVENNFWNLIVFPNFHQKNQILDISRRLIFFLFTIIANIWQ